MKKLNLFVLSIACIGSALSFASCGSSSKTISVCASEQPHAEVLKEACADLLKEKGYTLKVKVLDWTQQNDAVANKDYDANYFQHIPYLQIFEGKGDKELVATCKVHYEPLGIYKGNGTKDKLQDGKTFEICADTSNAIRALQLLEAKGVLTAEDLASAVNDETLTFDTTFTSANGVKITLIAEELLVASKSDYDFACLPCNTAITGNVSSDLQVAKEDDPAQVSAKANVLAVRKNDYLNNQDYKAKIDALTDVLLSDAVASYVKTKYLGAITCDASSQIDLRSTIK